MQKIRFFCFRKAQFAPNQRITEKQTRAVLFLSVSFCFFPFLFVSGCFPFCFHVKNRYWESYEKRNKETGNPYSRRKEHCFWQKSAEKLHMSKKYSIFVSQFDNCLNLNNRTLLERGVWTFPLTGSVCTARFRRHSGRRFFVHSNTGEDGPKHLSIVSYSAPTCRLSRKYSWRASSNAYCITDKTNNSSWRLRSAGRNKKNASSYRSIFRIRIHLTIFAHD